jgi:LPS export ABC transporter protein LptC
MRISKRNFIWLVPLALLLTFPLWRLPLAAFLAPRGGYDPALALNGPDSHDFTMNRVHITQSHHGQTTLTIAAVRAMTGQSSNEFRMEDVNATITSKEGEQTHVTAGKGLFDKGSSQLSLMDDVVINKPKDNYQIYTDLLHYNDKTKIANCPGPTRLLGEDVSIKGGSLEYNLLSKSYDIGGRVFCTLSNFVRP